MAQIRIRQVLGLGMLAVFTAWAQAPTPAPKAPAPPIVTVEQPDAQRTREQLRQLLGRYPPALRNVFALDSTLLSNQAYLAPYPALLSFLNAHPEIARNPSFYVGDNGGFPVAVSEARKDHDARILDLWEDVLGGFAGFAAAGVAIGLLVWSIRTIIDYRRWTRLAKVQTDTHTKLLDRFTANDDLLAYIQSPAGAKFLESAPIMLDAGPRSVGAPLGRILWSVQVGLVLAALGIGLQMVSGRVSNNDASQPLRALGILGIALGIGFVISAIISFMISRKLGLIERPSARPNLPGASPGGAA
jgi:hypothetical protein